MITPHSTTEQTLKSLLHVEDVHVRFPISNTLFSLKKNRSYVHALNGVSLSIAAGETLGFVGESGCGKSTVANTIAQLSTAYKGAIYYEDKNISELPKKEALAVRKNVQIIFQDPYSSLNPRMTVHDILAEPIHIYKKHGLLSVGKNEMEHEISSMLQTVGLSPDAQYRYPHHFSGGQRQRINIARALMLKPKVILADEAVSALDVSIQAQIINLFKNLQKTLGLAILFISHDLAVVRNISHRVAIMYCGKIVETGETQQIYKNPLHPYTQALLSAVNIPDPIREKKRKRISLSGRVPSLNEAPTHCSFYERCAHAMDRCAQNSPSLQMHENKQKVRCFLYAK